MNKTKAYIATVIVLLATNLLLVFSEEIVGSPNADSTYFDFSGEEVDAILIQNEGNTMELKRNGQQWMLNEEFQADQGFVSTLLSVFERLEKGRIVTDWQDETLGIVSISLANGKSTEFQFATDPNRTKTYFVTSDEAVQVAVPGYRDNVADIFLLHPDQWRDRLVIDGSWRTIQKVTVEGENSSFTIRFADDFFLLNGEAPRDSSAVIDYLNQFQFLQANEMISEGRFEALDSIAKVTVMARITIDDIKSEEPKVLRIFPNGRNQNYHLVIDESGQRMVFDGSRIRQLLTSPEADLRR